MPSREIAHLSPVVRNCRYKAIWRGDVIGWATTLRAACEGVYKAFLAAKGPQGGAYT